MYAKASTCDLILRLLTCHKDYAKFVENMTESLLNAEYGLLQEYDATAAY